jgi:hypothetical protein
MDTQDGSDRSSGGELRFSSEANLLTSPTEQALQAAQRTVNFRSAGTTSYWILLRKSGNGSTRT